MNMTLYSLFPPGDMLWSYGDNDILEPYLAG